MSKFPRSQKLRARKVLLNSVLALLLIGTGCSDDSEDIARKVGQVTESCSLNSDCANPLVCVFERCHEPCNADSDCPYPARCVQSDRTNVFACQFPDEATCSEGNDEECHSPLVCAEDDQCRSSCRRDADCPEEQSCSDEGVCAGERELDDDGKLITSGPTEDAGGESSPGDTLGSGDDGGAGAESSGDDVPSADDDPGSPSDLDAGPEATDGDEPTPEGENGGGPEPDGSHADAGDAPAEAIDEEESDAGGESTFDYFEEESSEEPLPNDTREEALPLTNASIWLEGADEDWFYLEVPDDGRAHVIELVQTQSIDLVSRVDFVAGADFSTLGSSVQTSAGATRTTYATVGPGTRTLLKFYATNRGIGRSEVTVSVTAEDDLYEPNQSREDAAPIALNTDITAQMIVPYVSATDRSSEDYYLVELAEGSAVFRLLNTPSNLRYGVDLLPIGEGSTSIIANTTRGDTGSWEFDVPTAGAYAIGIRDIENVGSFFSAPAAHLSESYSFRVEQ